MKTSNQKKTREVHVTGIEKGKFIEALEKNEELEHRCYICGREEDERIVVFVRDEDRKEDDVDVIFSKNHLESAEVKLMDGTGRYMLCRNCTAIIKSLVREKFRELIGKVKEDMALTRLVSHLENVENDGSHDSAA